MRKLKEVLRLYSLGLKQQQIARSCLIAQSTVHLYLKAAAAAGVKWPLPPDWDERRLEKAGVDLIRGEASFTGPKELEVRLESFFGEMAVIAGKPREATVKAVEHVEALRIPADGFQAFLQENPRIAVGMLKSLVERLREVQDRLDTWIGGVW